MGVCMSSKNVREVPLEDVPELLGSFAESEVEDWGWVVLHRAGNGLLVLTSPHSEKALVIS